MSDDARQRIIESARKVATHGKPLVPSTVNLYAEEDEHGMVTVRNESGALVMMMHRREWDTMRKELGMEPLEPQLVTTSASPKGPGKVE